MISYF